QPRDPNLPGCLLGYDSTPSDLYWALYNLTRHLQTVSAASMWCKSPEGPQSRRHGM
ncbi:hypothetical protein P7K49_025096, partial [Saguinus oedipus]